MRRTHVTVRALALPALALVALSGCGIGREGKRETVTWEADVPAGGVVRVRNMNGPIEVEAPTATRWRSGPSSTTAGCSRSRCGS